MAAETLRTALARAAILLQREGDDVGAKTLADHLVAIQEARASAAFPATLLVEVNGAAEAFRGRHTPAIVSTVHSIADYLETVGVQMAPYPLELRDPLTGEDVARVTLLDDREDLSHLPEGDGRKGDRRCRE